MEDFKDIDEELKKLEEEISLDEDIFKDVLPATTSVGEYWRKRVEEEKDIWSKVVEKKEQEKKELENRLSQTLSEVENLRTQVKELKELLQNETASFQEKLKARETEILIEKERLSSFDRIRDLERQNQLLLEEIERLKNNKKTIKEELESVHKRELQEILLEQKSLIENITQLENETKQLEEITKKQSEEINSYKQKVNNLTEEKEKLEKKIIELQNELESRISESEETENEIFDYFKSTIVYFSDKIRRFLGTIIGIVDFCKKRTKQGFLGKNNIIKNQLSIVEETVQNIISSIENLLGFSKKEELNIQEISLEKFFIKVSDKIDIYSLPSGLKVKADLEKLLKLLIKYCENALSVNIEYHEKPAISVIELKVLIPEKIYYSEDIIKLRFILNLHRWKMKLTSYEDKSELSIFIPVVKG